LALAPLLVTYAATRLYGLGALPAFLDESLYISWSLEAWTYWRRVLGSGKPLPLFLGSLIVPWFSDPLWTLRVLSTAAGASALGSVYALGQRWFGPRSGLLGAAWYLVCPYAFFYDRLAVGDVFLSAASGWVLVASLRVSAESSSSKSAAQRHWILLGLALGLAILSKTLGVVLLFTPPLVLALARAPLRTWRRLWLPYGVAAVVAGWPLWFFVRKSSETGKALTVDAGYLRAVVGNVSQEATLLAEWWTWGLAGLAAIGLLAAHRHNRIATHAALWSVVAPVAFVACLAQTWYPRYLLFATPPAAALAGAGAAWCIHRSRLWAIALLVAAYPALRLDVALLTDPAAAHLPAAEREQYVTGWSSGYGLREAAQFVKQRASATPGGLLVVAAHSEGRAVFLGLRTYLRALDDVRLVESAIDEDRRASGGEELVALPPRPSPSSDPSLELLSRHQRPDGSVAVELYRRR